MSSNNSDNAANKEQNAHPEANAAFDAAGSTNMLASKKIASAWQRLAESLTEQPEVWVKIVSEAQKKQVEITAEMGEKQTAAVSSLAGAGSTDSKSAAKKANQKTDSKTDSKTAKTADAKKSLSDNPIYGFLMQNYMLGGETLMKIINQAEVAEDDKKLLRFAANQYIAATSPANFPLTNPEVMEDTMQSGGQNIVNGIRNLAEDMQQGMVSNTDKTAYSVGDNIAYTPGAVIFQNQIMQLIEYAPQTPKVHARPLLIVPPCINKYYILDLQAHNSLVGHAIASGHRVFLVSWVNASQQHKNLRWDDYLRDGVMAALDTTSAVCGGEKVNVLGYCVGGTLLASALVALGENGAQPAASITLLAAMLDFSDTGEIGIFIDEDHVQAQEKNFAEGGLLDGADLARGFAALRPNDLIWPSVINNYYHGRKPPAFDLLYWNSDSVNLPGPMFAEYLRTCYLENRIAKGTAVFCDVPIDISTLTMPAYVVSCERDHIVPWHTVFESAKLLSGDTKFVLAGGGHIAGIVNPPTSNKGWHMYQNKPLLQSGKSAKSASKRASLTYESWREKAVKHEGGWWDDWRKWLEQHGGKKIDAPKRLGNTRFAKIEDAPGSYVIAKKPACHAVAEAAAGVANFAQKPTTALFGVPPFAPPFAGNNKGNKGKE